MSSSLTRALTSVPQGIYEESSTQKAPLGTPLVLSDGRVFNYAENAAVALTAGRLIQQGAAIANHGGTGLAAATVTAGNRVVAVDLGATLLTENQYAEGYLVSVDDTANPPVPDLVTMKVSGHPAADATATAVAITLGDAMVGSGIEAADQVSLIYNQYDQCIATAGVPTAALVGVTLFDIQADFFFWVQTKGVCGVLSDGGSLQLGDPVVISDDTAGAVGPYTSTQAIDETGLGDCIAVTAASDIAVINLRL